METFDRVKFAEVLQKIATSGVKLPTQTEKEYIEMRRAIVDSREVKNG